MRPDIGYGVNEISRSSLNSGPRTLPIRNRQLASHDVLMKHGLNQLSYPAIMDLSLSHSQKLKFEVTRYYSVLTSFSDISPPSEFNTIVGGAIYPNNKQYQQLRVHHDVYDQPTKFQTLTPPTHLNKSI